MKNVYVSWKKVLICQFLIPSQCVILWVIDDAIFATWDRLKVMPPYQRERIVRKRGERDGRFPISDGVYNGNGGNSHFNFCVFSFVCRSLTSKSFIQVRFLSLSSRELFTSRRNAWPAESQYHQGEIYSSLIHFIHFFISIVNSVHFFPIWVLIMDQSKRDNHWLM